MALSTVAAFYSVPGPPGDNLGLQLRGRAELLADQGSGGSGWQRFKITPDEVWCFDSRVDLARHKVELSHRLIAIPTVLGS
jgi:hypothetical protein